MKTPRLSKSGIEYLSHVWNPYSGCKHKQSGVCPPGFKCWAEGIATRFKDHYPNGFEPTVYPEAFLSPLGIKKPARIGVAFMGDLFGEWVDPEQLISINIKGLYKSTLIQMALEKADATDTLKNWIFNAVNRCPQHTFVFLTKNPAGYQKWGQFPDNCWLGASLCIEADLKKLKDMKAAQAKHKWISFEPLIEGMGDHWTDVMLKDAGISWVVIGGWSGGKKQPRIEWVKEIVNACDKAGIPVFLKDNLKPLLKDCVGIHAPYWRITDPANIWPYACQTQLRQELPL